MHATTSQAAIFSQREEQYSAFETINPIRGHYDAFFDSAAAEAAVPLINKLEKYYVESPVRLGTSGKRVVRVHHTSGQGWRRERRTEARAYKGSVSGQTGRNEAARVLFVRLSTPFLPPFRPYPLPPVRQPRVELRSASPLLHHLLPRSLISPGNPLLIPPAM